MRASLRRRRIKGEWTPPIPYDEREHWQYTTRGDRLHRIRFNKRVRRQCQFGGSDRTPTRSSASLWRERLR